MEQPEGAVVSASRAHWPMIRNVVLFVCGLAGVAFETIARRPPDYGLLPVFAGMIGLPWFVAQDEKSDDKRKRDQQ